MSNIIKLYPTHFPMGENIFLGGYSPPPWLRAWYRLYRFSKKSSINPVGFVGGTNTSQWTMIR